MILQKGKTLSLLLRTEIIGKFSSYTISQHIHSKNYVCSSSWNSWRSLLILTTLYDNIIRTEGTSYCVVFHLLNIILLGVVN